MREESGSTRAFTSGEVNLSPFEMTALASEGIVQRIQDQARHLYQMPATFSL
jgi:hypothetical protein